MSKRFTERDAAPWYRQGWPWALMAGPAAVVVAGIYTAWLAVKAPDALVVDDYYKEGKAINLSLDRDRMASQFGLRADIRYPHGEGGSVEIRMSSTQPMAWPPVVQLMLAHPVKAELDRVVEMRITSAQDQSAQYAGTIGPTEPIAYQVVLQDAGKRWRLTGDRRGVARDSISLQAQALPPGE